MLETEETGVSLSVCVCVCVRERGRDEWLSGSMWEDKIWINKNTPEDIQPIHIYNNIEIVTSDLEIGRQEKMKERKEEIQRENERG